jgi:hypothetical protein
MRYGLIQIFIFGFALLGCNSSNKDIKKKSLKDNDFLSSKYGSSVNWDTLSYTIQYQENFIEKNTPITFKGLIYDIVKVDSSYVLNVLDERENATQNFLASIHITQEQFERIETSRKRLSGVFIIRVIGVKTTNPSIKSDVRVYEIDKKTGEKEAEEYSYLSTEDDYKITVFTGNLIDFKIDD